MFEDKLIVIRGAGDVATGTIHRLFQCHFNLLCLETEQPSAIRRSVAYSECVYEGETVVEGVKAVKVEDIKQIRQAQEEGVIPVLVDEEGKILTQIQADVLIDAIIAKKNLGTRMDMAPLTIALGPGFEAGKDVHYVIETMRGHDLGRVIEKGFAKKNTGIPGLIAGKGEERVIHSPGQGKLLALREIGDRVKKGEKIALVGDREVYASLDGLLRGIIREGYEVYKGMKIADIDPRLEEYENCFTISDKARAIAGGVLEAIFRQGF